MTKRAAGVSWLWPSSRLCFEHSCSVRDCALSRNSVGPPCTFEESKSRRKLADRKLVNAVQRPRREALKNNNYQSRPQQKHQKSTNYQSRPQKSTISKKSTNENTNYKSRPKKHKQAHTKKHKLPTTITRKSTNEAQTKHQQSTNYQS